MAHLVESTAADDVATMNVRVRLFSQRQHPDKTLSRDILRPSAASLWIRASVRVIMGIIWEQNGHKKLRHHARFAPITVPLSNF